MASNKELSEAKGHAIGVAHDVSDCVSDAVDWLITMVQEIAADEGDRKEPLRNAAVELDHYLTRGIAVVKLVDDFRDKILPDMEKAAKGSEFMTKLLATSPNLLLGKVLQNFDEQLKEKN